ncbi:Flp family type IVb pilin [Pontibacillus sp. HMF3514]|uniref:Flp family type IVb pilin n=1 Tax=Pontibacillus sp. HMF3514 TaxID=2692425 RepID=UPI00131FEDB3|nr:Flp family type IVb pilin [Pontibacillus sp. HMF3514]QHE51392.1 Flp family type IVb pilin [Pontibacillus sp. HMF3514]
MVSLIESFLYEEDGQGMTEYSIVLGVISIAAFGIIILLTEELQQVYTRVVDAVQSRDS